MTKGLIGRRSALDALHGEIGRTVTSHGGLVLITGEAGIGKTALAVASVQEAARQGAVVLTGNCWESDGAPNYWPWVQIARRLRRTAAADEWAQAGSSLACLLGEPAEPLEGFALHDAVTTALVAISQSRPVVVLIEDLHWADPGSMALLEFAARHTWFERLLVICTYRDAEMGEPLAARATVIRLDGLPPEDVGRLMAQTAGRPPEPRLVREMHRRTGGNPFFVEQATRLTGGGAAGTIPPEVRQVLSRRLSLLPEPVRRLLTVAAVLGGECDGDVLSATARQADVPYDERMIGEAVTAGLLTEREGRLAFVHDLVRQTLYDTLTRRQAEPLHAAAVRAQHDTAPAELAVHVERAGGELDRHHALDLLKAAARDAVGRLARQEAAAHHRRALAIVGEHDVRARVLILLGLGQELHHAGDRDGARLAFAQAADLARGLDAAEPLAHVALAVNRIVDPARRGAAEIELLYEAHARLGTPSAPDLDSAADELTALALVVGRHAGDEELGFALGARHDAIWGPDSRTERGRLLDETVEVARRLADRKLEHYALAMRWVLLIEQGDPAYLRAFRAYLAYADGVDRPHYQLAALVDRAIVAVLQGGFAEAESLLDQAESFAPHNLSEHAHVRHDHVKAHLRWALALRQGRFEELGPAGDDYPYPKILDGIAAAERGDTEGALHLFKQACAEDVPYPGTYAALWLRFQAQAAACSGDPELIEDARAALAPHLGHWAVSLFGFDISGPMDLWSALLDAAQQRWGAAIDGFARAREQADGMRARPWSAEAGLHLALALRGRGTPADIAAADDLLAEVADEARALGMRQLTARAETCRPQAEPHRDVFHFDGRVWTLAFAGRTVHLPDSKGLRDLHLLLGRPGQEVPAVRLLNPRGGETVAYGGDPVLDEEAKTRYRARLALLDDEIDRAALSGDEARTAELDRERAALLSELRTAAGLAGRTRRLGDERERARKAVTARIKDALRRLDEWHPALAAHLRAGISTGTACLYRPDREVEWRL
ncbi:ATP-binding protein [Spirillospora sp. NPDC127200]